MIETDFRTERTNIQGFGSMNGFFDDEENLKNNNRFTIETTSIGFGEITQATFGNMPIEPIRTQITADGTIRTWDIFSIVGHGGSEDTSFDHSFFCEERSYNGSNTVSVTLNMF